MRMVQNSTIGCKCSIDRGFQITFAYQPCNRTPSVGTHPLWFALGLGLAQNLHVGFDVRHLGIASGLTLADLGIDTLQTCLLLLDYIERFLAVFVPLGFVCLPSFPDSVFAFDHHTEIQGRPIRM